MKTKTILFAVCLALSLQGCAAYEKVVSSIPAHERPKEFHPSDCDGIGDAAVSNSESHNVIGGVWKTEIERQILCGELAKNQNKNENDIDNMSAFEAMRLANKLRAQRRAKMESCLSDGIDYFACYDQFGG